MKTNAAENNNCIKAIVTVKNLFFNYVSLTGLDIDLTVSSSESRVVLERKRPNFSLWLSLRVWGGLLSDFEFESRPFRDSWKLIYLLFLKRKGFLLEQFTSDYLSTMEDKNPWNGYGKPSFHILNLSNIQM